MSAIGRGTAVAAVIIAAAGTLTGCTWRFDQGKEFQDDRTESATVTEVQLIGGDGSVTLTRSTGTTIQIHRKVWYRGHRPDGRQDRVDGTALVLDTRCGRQCVVSYEVTVPAEVNVSGHLDTGPVDLAGVGTVAVDTGDGSIAVRGASGNVTVQTDTGQIRLETVAGKVTARTQDGGILVHTGAKDVTAETDTGPIELTDIAGAAELRTADGGINLDGIGGPVTAETDTGPINATNLKGAKTLARTEDGSITLRLTTAQDVEASTGTGPISVTVPPFAGGYHVRTQTENGPTSVQIPDNPTGTRSLTLKSTDGGITVDQA
jgi:DUF4097 and DUF4098 domain-containing protein YvlB